MQQWRSLFVHVTYVNLLSLNYERKVIITKICSTYWIQQDLLPFSIYFQILYIFAQIFKYFALFLKNDKHALTS